MYVLVASAMTKETLVVVCQVLIGESRVPVLRVRDSIRIEIMKQKNKPYALFILVLLTEHSFESVFKTYQSLKRNKRTKRAYMRASEGRG